MAIVLLALLGLLAAGVVWVFASLARRLRRATLLVNAHQQLQQRLLAEAVHHADIDPFAQTVLDHLRQHTNRTTKLKGLT
ncbi:hypothetical protein [Nocardiopsis synnemataformans]|uniref:hypothetical protein n=1 Tax=Nocardiopsis synnemataformans TaxID=61305 RepID=UPI003EB8ACFC